MAKQVKIDVKQAFGGLGIAGVPETVMPGVHIVPEAVTAHPLVKTLIENELVIVIGGGTKATESDGRNVVEGFKAAEKGWEDMNYQELKSYAASKGYKFPPNVSLANLKEIIKKGESN